MGEEEEEEREREREEELRTRSSGGEEGLAAFRKLPCAAVKVNPTIATPQ